MKDKENNLVFYVCSKIPFLFDAMSTSLVESINSSLKNGIGVMSNFKTRLVCVFFQD
jgi:hypothetical protein